MTLTDTAKVTKRIFKIGAIFLVVIFSVWLSYRFYYYNIYVPSLPPKEIKPDFKFGKLPRPPLPQSSVTSSNYSYALDTVTGNLPSKIPKVMRVYYSPQLGTTLLSFDRATSLASSFGFTQGPEVISPTQYRFKDDKGGEFLIDLNSGNFKYDKKINPSEIQGRDTPFQDENKLIADFRSFLSGKGLHVDLLQEGEAKLVFEKSNRQDSYSANISLWQSNLSDYPIVTPTFTEGLIKTTISRSGDEKQKYIKLDYSYWPIDKDTIAYYPIITVEQAYTELRNGSGSVVKEPTQGNASISKVYLAYLLASQYTPYVQPIYVFEGQAYVAYVQAIPKDYLETSP